MHLTPKPSKTLVEVLTSYSRPAPRGDYEDFGGYGIRMENVREEFIAVCIDNEAADLLIKKFPGQNFVTEGDSIMGIKDRTFIKRPLQVWDWQE